jgi:ABC-type transporter Mla subunit MlaD
VSIAALQEELSTRLERITQLDQFSSDLSASRKDNEAFVDLLGQLETVLKEHVRQFMLYVKR